MMQLDTSVYATMTLNMSSMNAENLKISFSLKKYIYTFLNASNTNWTRYTVF